MPRRFASAIISCRSGVPMASEHRLHPASIAFMFAAAIRQFALPGLAALVTAGSAGWGWQPWMWYLLIPHTILALGRYLSFRYRYGPNEMVIRTGFFFRNERHIPYARIQNLDAVQNVFHRLLGVADVRVETGAGNEPEARMTVLPLEAFAEMRRRVFAEREKADTNVEGFDSVSSRDRLLLRLNPRELILRGLLEYRGVVLIAVTLGVLWELGLGQRISDAVLGDRPYDQAAGELVAAAGRRGILRDLAAAAAGYRLWPLEKAALALAALSGFVVVVTLLSAAWALIRLYGFTLVRTGADLRTEYGLFTKVTATIPLGRVQTLTIREGPLYRLFERASIDVDTAGSSGTDARRGGGGNRRESLAPILGRADLTALVEQVLPDFRVDRVVWQPAHPRAFARKRTRMVRVAVAVYFALLFLQLVVLGSRSGLPMGRALALFSAWNLALLAVLLGVAVLHAQKYVSHLGWAVADDAVLFRSGWIWQRTSITRFAKIQAVTILESPFDRLAAMVRVSIDAAGAGPGSHRIDIPYLGRETARDLYGALAMHAARTEFDW
jgi:putative membrane protein